MVRMILSPNLQLTVFKIVLFESSRISSDMQTVLQFSFQAQNYSMNSNRVSI